MVVVYKGKPKKSKKSKPKRRAVSMPRIGLPMCTMKYANAIANPFAANAYGACVPVGNFRPSMKNHARAFYSVTIGTAGVGYFAYSPCLANNTNCCFFTNSTYAGDINTPGNTTATGVVTGLMATLPFSSVQLIETDSPGSRNDVQGRIVSAGIKWRYTGTELNRGGTILAYSDPLHQTLEAQSYSVLSSFTETAMTAPDANHTSDYLTVFACNYRELNYPDTTVDTSASLDILSCLYPFSDQVGCVSSANTGAPIAIVYFQGAPGNTYLVEVVIHSEYEGKLAQQMLTPNNSDEQGSYRVQAAASRATSQGATGRSSFMTRFWNSYKELERESMPVLMDAYRVAKSGLRMVGAWQNQRYSGSALMRQEF